MFGEGSDTVISGNFAGRKVYIHPASGIAAVADDLGRNIQHVVKDITYHIPQGVEREDVPELVTHLESEGFDVISYKFANSEEGLPFSYDTIEESRNANAEYLGSFKLAKDRDEVEYHSGKIRTGFQFLIPPVLRSLGSIYESYPLE